MDEHRRAAITASVAVTVEALSPGASDLDIDIRPYSINNRIYRWMFLIPVAILSTPELDALHDIDRSTITFGATGDEASRWWCPSHGVDVNGDGLKDLTCLFKKRLTGLQRGDTSAVLRAVLSTTGQVLEGRDSVEIR